MERIGIAASKMAKGNLLLYNFWVLVISFVFSLFIYLLAGSSIVLSLIIIGYIVKGVLPLENNGDWLGIMRICLVSLTVVVSLLNLCAVLKNIKLRKVR